MKRLIIALVILAAIVTAGILENVYVDKLFDGLDARLSSIEQSIVEKDGNAEAQIDETIAWWEGKRKYAELFLYSPDIRALSVALGETKGSLECEDFSNALSKVRSLQIMSGNLRNILDFNLADII